MGCWAGIHANAGSTCGFILVWLALEFLFVFSRQVTVKDDVLRQGEHVHARTEAAGVNVKIEQLREEWSGIESDLSRERGRLEKIMRLWKDYDRKQEEMYDWLTGILSSLRELEHRDKSIDVVRSQIALIQVGKGG